MTKIVDELDKKFNACYPKNIVGIEIAPNVKLADGKFYFVLSKSQKTYFETMDREGLKQYYKYFCCYENVVREELDEQKELYWKMSCDFSAKSTYEKILKNAESNVKYLMSLLAKK